MNSACYEFNCRVMNKLISAIRTDWMAEGVTEETLDALRSIWQAKLDAAAQGPGPEALLFGDASKVEVKEDARDDPSPEDLLFGDMKAESKRPREENDVAAMTVKREKKSETAGDGDDDDDSSLSSDSDSVAAEVLGAPPESQILCQFVNVKGSKGKWKAAFKDGICKLNGQDYVFSTGLANLKRW